MERFAPLLGRARASRKEPLVQSFSLLCMMNLPSKAINWRLAWKIESTMCIIVSATRLSSVCCVRGYALPDEQPATKSMAISESSRLRHLEYK